jgi:creatinine amidohydrolase
MDASELYDPEFRKLIKSKNPTIIIPVGSLEQHGAHLPITTDSDIVTEIASRLAKKCGFIVFPTVSYGLSFEHSPLTNINTWSPGNPFRDSGSSRHSYNFLFEIICSIWEMRGRQHLVRKTVARGPGSWAKHATVRGIDKGLSIIILNGHHGNVEELNKLVKIRSTNVLIDMFKDTLSLHSYWHFMEHEFDHAGFVETSIMLAISDKVKMKKAKKGLITKGLSEKERKRINKLSTQPGGFPKVAKNGVWGDPTGATKKDGEKFLAEIVRNLAKECQT